SAPRLHRRTRRLDLCAVPVSFYPAARSPASLSSRPLPPNIGDTFGRKALPSQKPQISREPSPRIGDRRSQGGDTASGAQDQSFLPGPLAQNSLLLIGRQAVEQSSYLDDRALAVYFDGHPGQFRRGVPEDLPLIGAACGTFAVTPQGEDRRLA